MSPVSAPITPFRYGPQELRTVTIQNEVWFVAKDIADILGIKWFGSKTLNSIPENWKGVGFLPTPSSGDRGGGTQEMLIINEPALYKLAFRSNKPEAQRFTNWVAGEVLPELRKTGRYKMPIKLPLDTSKLIKAVDEVARMSYRHTRQMEEALDAEERKHIFMRYVNSLSLETERIHRLHDEVADTMPHAYLPLYKPGYWDSNRDDLEE